MPEVGPGQTLLHDPQCAGCVGSTHDPLQSSDVGALHPNPHIPLVHVAWPVPPLSGPSHTLLQLPQCAGLLGSTHTPLQFSDVGAVHPPPSEPPPSVVGPSSPIWTSSPIGASTPPSTVLPSPMEFAHVFVSLHVPDVSVPQPARLTPIAVAPTHKPRVTK
jgi:hypothetical protein